MLDLAVVFLFELTQLIIMSVDHVIGEGVIPLSFLVDSFLSKSICLNILSFLLMKQHFFIKFFESILELFW